MARSAALGILGVEGVHFFVHELERGRSFWVDKLDFAFTGASTEAAAEKNGERTEVYQAADVTYLYTSPLRENSTSGAYLKRHPDGVAEVLFRVKDAQKTFDVLVERGGTPTSDVQRTEGEGGSLAWFSITTAFGDVRFTFVERDGYRSILPGIERFATPQGGNNRFGFGHIDHITSNFLTLQPLLLWCKEVLGFEEYWGIEFHTDDVSKNQDRGSGLRSTVVWDPASGVKFANNEPKRPFFEASQIYTFVEDNHGPGIQHTALTIENIMEAVPQMRAANIEFMPTPGVYYEMLVPRLEGDGIELDEEISALAEREILVDGEGPGKYMLQIFCKDFARLFNNPNGGPFFLEIIQRKGDRGFGGGNFRALFESIERQQRLDGR